MAADLTSGTSKTLAAPARAELCLDFANTLCWRGSDPPSEALRGLDDLLAWCTAAGVQDGPVIDRLGSWWRAHPVRGTEVFAEAIGLREAIYRILTAAARSGEPKLTDLDGLNCALSAAPARLRLKHHDGGYTWQIRQPAPSVALLLAPVLWSAGDLLTQPGLRRVRQCANDKCLWLFLDDSKSGTRRWCSMSMCGNRAKARRHYLRVKHPLRSP
jgi:predicted RNA-binding Zn ribbon-like protein